MITIPIALTHKDIAVFPDDQDCNLYYCIRTTPQIRKTGDLPVFSGLFWTDKGDGSMESTAGIAGGWINFDANLGVSAKEENEIAGKIRASGIQQSRYGIIRRKEEERQRLRLKASGAEAAKGTTELDNLPSVGAVHFGSINFTEGNVVLLEESEGDIVTWSSSGGKASMFGDNNAAFALRLSPAGGAIWYKALKGEAKAISIRYDLKFQIRVPSLEIRVYAGSTQRSEIHRDVERVWKNVDRGCTDADVERIDVKSVTRSLVDDGLINIEIKKGSAEISQEYVSQLRESMMKILESKVEEIIKSRVQGMTREQMDSSMIRLMTEEVNSFVELRFMQEDMIEWSIAPQGTIMNFLQDVPEKMKQQVTKLVDLSEAEVSTNKILVNVSAPWDEPPYATQVKVDMVYLANGKKESFLFKKGDPAAVWQFRKPLKDDGIVAYTTYAYFKGHAEPYLIPEQKTQGHVNINIGKIGVVDLAFKPHPYLISLSGKNKITSIQMDLSYVDRNGKCLLNDSIMLTPEKIEGETYQRDLGTFLDQPLLYNVTYYFKEREPLEVDQKKIYLADDGIATVYSPYPFEDTLDLQVEMPFIPHDIYKKVLVEFIYKDQKNDFESTDLVILSKEDDWEPVTARLVVLDKSIADFKYRFRLHSSDEIVRSEWIDGHGEAETVLLPIRKVVIGLNLLKLGTDYSGGFLRLHCDGVKAEKLVVLDEEKSKSPLEWYLPGTANADPEYAYDLNLFDAKGKAYQSTGTWKGSMFMLPKP